MNRAPVSLFFLLFATCAFAQRALERSAANTVPSRPSAIVIGFVGGFVRSDNAVHGTVQLAARLRREYPSGVVVRVFENRREDQAYREVLRLLDGAGDGQISAAERRNAHIVIFGHSWGGSETVELARRLEKQGIPVLLTVQVDSVHKRGENDSQIPANVREAANFYQSDGMLHGRAKIYAADPERTKIIGNFKFTYKTNPIGCEDRYPMIDRVFMKAHTEIECDPRVWSEVESLIKANLPSPAHGT
jgi:pimeloyl-ACP methyl ester carboxylesterase